MFVTVLLCVHYVDVCVFCIMLPFIHSFFREIHPDNQSKYGTQQASRASPHSMEMPLHDRNNGTESSESTVWADHTRFQSTAATYQLRESILCLSGFTRKYVHLKSIHGDISIWTSQYAASPTLLNLDGFVSTWYTYLGVARSHFTQSWPTWKYIDSRVF